MRQIKEKEGIGGCIVYKTARIALSDGEKRAQNPKDKKFEKSLKKVLTKSHFESIILFASV